MKKNWKDIVAHSIVAIVMLCIIGVIGYAFYMGGWQAFIVFLGVFGALIGALGLFFVIVWAFSRVLDD
jgi:Ca2+/H+ antiporter